MLIPTKVDPVEINKEEKLKLTPPKINPETNLQESVNTHVEKSEQQKKKRMTEAEGTMMEVNEINNHRRQADRVARTRCHHQHQQR